MENEARIEEDKRKPIEIILINALLVLFYELPRLLTGVLEEIKVNQQALLAREPQYYKQRIESISDKWIEQNRDKWRGSMGSAIGKTIDLSRREMANAELNNAYTGIGVVSAKNTPLAIDSQASSTVTPKKIQEPIVADIDVSLALRQAYLNANASELNSVLSSIVLNFGFLVDAIITWTWPQKLINEKLEQIKNKIDTQIGFIGTNCVLKVYTQSLEDMCKSIGIEGYEWQTMEDNRVRPSHAANNGKFFLWDKPNPETGKPGDQPNCRCLARIRRKVN